MRSGAEYYSSLRTQAAIKRRQHKLTGAEYYSSLRTQAAIERSELALIQSPGPWIDHGCSNRWMAAAVGPDSDKQ